MSEESEVENKIIEIAKYRGRIRVEAKVDEVAAFYFTLPKMIS